MRAQFRRETQTQADPRSLDDLWSDEFVVDDLWSGGECVGGSPDNRSKKQEREINTAVPPYYLGT